ncbi:MAG: rhodanese-like domain-containing protein [Actinomycetia bacterium]|nr:rhodanese-like domain-containing protein [Actinomycetes bacterium]
MRIVRITLIIALTCLLSFGLVGCGNKAGSAPDGNEHDVEMAAFVVAAGYAQGRYEIINAEQMKDWVDLGEIMTVIDIRPESDYLKGHLPGAVNAEINRDEESTTEQIQAFLELMPSNPESIVVVYDDYTLLNGSHRAAIYAADAGFTKVFRLVGGAVGWVDAGNSLTKK